MGRLTRDIAEAVRPKRQFVRVGMSTVQKNEVDKISNINWPNNKEAIKSGFANLLRGEMLNSKMAPDDVFEEVVGAMGAAIDSVTEKTHCVEAFHSALEKLRSRT